MANSSLHRLALVWVSCFCLLGIGAGLQPAQAADGPPGTSPTVLAPHRIQIVMPTGWSWKDGSFTHVGGARAAIEVSVVAGSYDYCGLQVKNAELDIMLESRAGDVPEDLGPKPAGGWSTWLPVDGGKNIMSCGRVESSVVSLTAVQRLTASRFRDIKVTLTGRDLGAGNALVAALAQAENEGTPAPPPRAPTTSPRAPTTLRLPLFDVELQLPDDGMTWSLLSSAEKEGVSSVVLSRLSPAQPPLTVAITRPGPASCSEIVSAFPAATPISGLPTGWRRYSIPGLESDLLLCIDIDTMSVQAQFSSARPIEDVAPFVPMLKAIEAALQSPARPPVSPSGPTSRYSSYDQSILMASWNLEVPISWRDSSDDAIPSLRAAFPGYEANWLVAASSGFLHRGNIAMAVDMAGVISNDVTLSPRFGGQHVEMTLDFGFSFELGDATRFGLTAGWHGVVGPITKNSSIALSAIFASYLEEDVGLSVRVTPVQLLAANERQLMSPLTVDVRVMLGMLALGLEVQYIGPPEPGDEDIPAEAMAFILRFGIGFGRPY